MTETEESREVGRFIRAHRASGGSYLVASAVGLAFSVGLGWYASSSTRTSVRALVGAALCGLLALWMLSEGWRLRRLFLRIHESGFIIREAGMEHVVEWEEVASFEARYVPGLRNRGVRDEANLVAIIVHTDDGDAFSLPKELHDFRRIALELKERSDAPWQSVLVASFVQR